MPNPVISFPLAIELFDIPAHGSVPVFDINLKQFFYQKIATVPIGLQGQYLTNNPDNTPIFDNLLNQDFTAIHPTLNLCNLPLTGSVNIGSTGNNITLNIKTIGSVNLNGNEMIGIGTVGFTTGGTSAYLPVITANGTIFKLLIAH